MAESPVIHVQWRDGRSLHSGPTHAVFGNPGLQPDVYEDVRVDPYAAWRWDGTTLDVRVDRYGFYPMYYYATGTDLFVAPSISALLNAGVPARLNDEALAVMLRLGFLVGDETVFDGIHMLPPHGRLRWMAGTLDVTGHLVTVSPSSLSRTAAIDGYRERFQSAVARRPASGVSIVPLSGGRDSRHIFLELCAQGRAPDVAVTMSLAPTFVAQEVEMAAIVTSRQHVRHVVVEQPAMRWAAEVRNVIQTHFSALEHWWLQPFLEYLETHQATVYEGIGGDVLSTLTKRFRSPERTRWYERGQFDQLADDLLGPEGYLPAMLSREQYARSSRAVAHERVVRELARHTDAPRPMASFLVYNRMRRVTALPPTSLMGDRALVWCPYLDAEVFDFLLSLPNEIFDMAEPLSFHTETIARAYPAFSDIPYAPSPICGRGANAYTWRLIRDMSWSVLKGGTGLVRPRFLMMRLLYGVLYPNYQTEIVKLAPFMSYLATLGGAVESLTMR